MPPYYQGACTLLCMLNKVISLLIFCVFLFSLIYCYLCITAYDINACYLTVSTLLVKILLGYFGGIISQTIAMHDSLGYDMNIL